MKSSPESWKRMSGKIRKDFVRVRVPWAFLSVLASFLRHVGDAMDGDDRPDHGLAMMRQGLEYTREPFNDLFLRLAWADKRMSISRKSKASKLYSEYRKAKQEHDRRWQAEIRRSSGSNG